MDNTHTASTGTDYAVRLQPDTGRAATILVHGHYEARAAVHEARTKADAPTASVIWVKKRPTCAYCLREPATRYVRDSGEGTPLCLATAREHYGPTADIRYNTGRLGVTRFEEVSPDDYTGTPAISNNPEQGQGSGPQPNRVNASGRTH